MDLQKKLANLGIEQVRKLDNETKEVSNNVNC